MRREEKRREEKDYRDCLAPVALALGILVAWSVPEAVAVVLVEFPSATGGDRVLLSARGGPSSLVDPRTGQPAEAPSLEEVVTATGGRLRWVVNREDTDHLGYRHVFYQQHYLPAGALPPGVAAWAPDGLQLAGGNLGFHYDASGNLYSVAGARFEVITGVTPLRITSVDAARLAAFTALQAAPGVSVTPDGDLDPDRLAELRERTTLRLGSVGDGRTFTPVWTLRMETVEGSVLAAAVDGTSSELLSYWDPSPTSDCEPSTWTAEQVPGIPQNPGLSNRSLWAVPTSEQSGFTHEGAWPHSGPIVAVIVYKGEPRVDACFWPGTQWYSVLPLRDNGSAEEPVYDDFTTPEIVPGRAAADAAWKTHQTMSYFASQGRFGWNGKMLPARVVVDACDTDWTKDNAMFEPDGGFHGPAGSVVIFPRRYRTYSMAASLDVVAHEWGHGVIYSSVGWTYDDYLSKQLHEGWADVVGYTVEWASEPQGSGPETADWTYDEDSGSPYRQVIVDDGPLGLSFHADDPEYYDPQWEWGHFAGNRLPVALRLSAVGGHNPVCTRLPTLSGCDIDVTAISATKAGALFFRTLASYCNATHEWDDFAELAREAAYDLFATSTPCYNADEEQHSAMDAFSAIGYPPPQAWLICRCGPSC